MEQIATMTVKHELFEYADIASLRGRQFTLDYPDFGCHVYEIRGVEQSDPLYLNLTCVVLDPDPDLIKARQRDCDEMDRHPLEKTCEMCDPRRGRDEHPLDFLKRLSIESHSGY